MVEAVVGVALRAVLASVLLGGVLAALVYAATRLVALNAATRHALWTTALLAIAAIPVAGIGVSVWKSGVLGGAPAHRATAAAAFMQPSAGDAAPATHARNAVTPPHAPSSHAQKSPAASHERPLTTSSTPSESSPSASSPSASAAAPWYARIAGDTASAGARVATQWTPRTSRTVALAAVAIWAAGAIAGLIGLLFSVLRVRGLKRRSSPLDGTLADDLPWLTESTHGREIYLRLSYETETPVAIGFRRPVILIPTELATADGLAAIEPLVMHEHAHLRRYDDWTNLAQRIIERVFWFNPIVWILGRRIALEREIASDDAVVQRTGAAHAYATSLWRLAREMRMPEHAVVAPGALLTRKQISVRIEQLLDRNRARLHRSPATALGIAVVSTLAVVMAATSAPAVELPPAEPSASTHAAGTSDTAAWVRSPGAPQPQHVVRVLHVDANVTPPHANALQVHVNAVAPHVNPVAPPANAVVPPRRLVPTTVAVVAPKPRASAAGMSSAASSSSAASASSAGAAARASNGVLSPEDLDAIRSAARVGPTVARSVKDALASLPRDIAQDDSSIPHRRFAGTRLTRDLVTACNACDFRNADLHGLDLHGVTLTGADFSNADMRGVNLSGATLKGVSLRRANLTDADARNAHFIGTELDYAVFDRARLDGATFVGVSLQHVTLRGLSMRAVISACTGCDLAGMDLRGADLHGITLSGADLSNADLRNANLSGARFNGVDFSSAKLAGADLTNANFAGCDLSGADLRQARTTGIKLQGTDLGD